MGFKRLVFSEEIIETEVKPVWEKVRDLVNNDQLTETVMLKKDGTPIINKKTQTVRTQLNFPKSEEHTFFVRGSGTDSTKKPLELNGIRMYSQYLWMKGNVINRMLGEIDYI